MSRRPNPDIHDYCRPCFGWGATTVKGSDYEDEIECVDCAGTGRRSHVNEKLRRHP